MKSLKMQFAVLKNTFSIFYKKPRKLLLFYSVDQFFCNVDERQHL